MQYSLFGARPLFDAQSFARRTREWRDNPVASLQQRADPIVSFSRELRRIMNSPGDRRRVKEPELEQAFNQEFFVKLLGYELYPGRNDSWTAVPKPKSSDTGLSGEPDLVLGKGGLEDFQISAVVELKKPGTPLDAPQPSYQGRSPVEQAFEYASNLANCKWVIVSDMRSVRLYSVSSQDQYHEIDLQDDPTFRSLDCFDQAYRLLAYENLVEDGPDAPTARLLAACQDFQSIIRDAFYKIYGDIRSELLSAVENWSSGRHSRPQLVFATQRLLDRLLFIYFCEHHPDRLLHANLVKEVTDRSIRSPGA